MEERKKFIIKHKDEFSRDGKWFLARRSLDLASFGMNVVDLLPGEKITEHTETKRDQEEVFVVMKGTARIVIDDNEYAMPEGTFARLDPELRRYVKNDSKEIVSVLIVSAPRTSGYMPMDWA